MTKYKFDDVLNALDEVFVLDEVVVADTFDEVGVLDVVRLFQFCIFSE